MGRWKYNGLIPGQAVNAHIKEAAYRQTQKGEDNYQKYFHGCLLWTYHRPEVNSSLVLLPGMLLLSLRDPIYRDEAIWVENRIAPILDRLPAQEGVGHSIDDIPDIGGVTCARTAHCDYVPRCS
jgi:hypothetical protein